MRESAALLCPYCAAKLRVKDRALVGKQIECPDCHGPIEICADGPTELRIVALDRRSREHSKSPKTRSSAGKKPVKQRTRRVSGMRSTDSQEVAAKPSPRGWAAMTEWFRCGQIADSLRRPATIGWIVAGAFAMALALVVLWDIDRADIANPVRDSDRDRASVAADAGQPPPFAGRPHRQPATSVPSNERPGNRDSKIDPSTRLEQLGKRVAAYVRIHGHFPVGTVAHHSLSARERFGWLAVLPDEEGRQTGATPLWDRSWQDPLNARFVRRRRLEFQNPAIDQLVGNAGYPATHFVGMAGVGDDAAELPVDHRRAGIFGYERRTTVDDVQDGLSNTMLLAGVQDNLGAWAAGGRATVRGLTQRPYVNGPDGFGSGQPDGMFVLTADGRARFISKSTDPVLLERMAAMSDESRSGPLRRAAPGGPDQPDAPRVLARSGDDRDGSGDGQDRRGVQPVAAPLPPHLTDTAGREVDVADGPAAGGEDTEPEPPAPPQPVDVAAALKQPIRRFEQVRSVPFRELLLQMEELAGVPIRFDEQQITDIDKRFEEPVSVILEQTTVGEILQAVVEQVGLAYDIEATGIRLRPQAAGDAGL